MKSFIFIAIFASILCGCSSKKPPQPRGASFPINVTVQEVK